MARKGVVGALALLADGYQEELRRLGYGPCSGRRQMDLLADLSEWIYGKEISPHEVTSAVVTAFLAERRRLGERLVTTAGARPLLDYLRRHGVIPEPTDVQSGPLASLLERYHDYLTRQRGLKRATIVRYEVAGRLFIDATGLLSESDIRSLSAADVSRFVINASKREVRGSPRDVMSSLRSFLRFLHIEGAISTPLVRAVPSYRSWRGGQLPRSLSQDQIDRLLRSCDRHTALGRRDYAVLVLLSRLGLRAGEVVAMNLDDIDWRAGEVVVHGKGPRTDRLPVPSDVGAAVAAYLREGRPPEHGRHLFLSTKAPLVGLSRGGVTSVVARACERAGLARVGARHLRHSAATAMLRSGASLPEIGQVLRHRRVDTTAIYAKVDQAALSLVARRWPGAVS